MLLNERGLTLAEILAAVAIIGIGLVGLAVVIPISSFGVQEGNQLSTATFYAEQRMEQVRNALWTGQPANDCVGTGPTAEPTVPTGSTCTPPAGTSQAAGTVTFANDTPLTGYSRTVRIQDCAVTACGTGSYTVSHADVRLVTVTVTYTPITATGTTAATAKSATVQLLVAKR